MSFSPSFQISSFNTGGTIDPTAVILVDNSTGSDGNIASRKILFYSVQGALAVPAIPWPLATNPITVNPLSQDVALTVLVQWLDGSGNVLYSFTIQAAFTGYGEQFWYNLIQTESASPTILQDVNYQNYKGTLRNYLDSAVKSISIGGSVGLGNAQGSILQEQYLVTNSNLFY